MLEEAELCRIHIKRGPTTQVKEVFQKMLSRMLMSWTCDVGYYVCAGFHMCADIKINFEFS